LIEYIQEVQPLDHFTHKFSKSERVDEMLAVQADVIIADLQRTRIKKVLDILLSCKKKGAELIVLAESRQVDELSPEDLEAVDDLWIIPMTRKEMRFRFARWQQNYKLQKDLWLSQNYLNTTINSVPYLIWYKDKAGAHQKVNEYFCESVNKSMEEVQGRGHYYIWDVTPDEYASGEYICMESEFEVMDKRRTCVFDEHVKIRNEIRQLKTYKSPLFDLDGSVMGTVGIAIDVTQERMYEEALKGHANMDFLTGLYNRRYISEFFDRAEEEILVVYYLDLDNFKSVNDQYGHKEGDEALLLTAEVLKKTMPGGTVARIGGDEFLVVEQGDFTEDEIIANRERIKEALLKAFARNEHFHGISVSIGTAHSEGGKDIMDRLISKADELMYREKKEKKDTRR
jgi:diguanylate cyclase (GGDEF)-like protein/PAS domain S-box-containing protein